MGWREGEEERGRGREGRGKREVKVVGMDWIRARGREGNLVHSLKLRLAPALPIED